MVRYETIRWSNLCLASPRNTRKLRADIGSNCEASCVVSCPSGWEREGDRCYLWSDDRKNWFDAEEICKSHGGHLASVTDQDIHDYMLKKRKKHWIGGFLGNEEGIWKWTDCSEWTFDSGWGEGEPNFVDSDKCVEYRFWNNVYGIGFYNDHCNNLKPSVCSKRICSGIKWGDYQMFMIFFRGNQPNCSNRNGQMRDRWMHHNLHRSLGGEGWPVLPLEPGEAVLGSGWGEMQEPWWTSCLGYNTRCSGLPTHECKKRLNLIWILDTGKHHHLDWSNRPSRRGQLDLDGLQPVELHQLEP